MVTIDEFSRLVSGIYRSAVSPADWVFALNEIRCAVGAIGGGLCTAEGPSRHLTAVNVPTEALTSYGQYYQHFDYVVAAVETGPVGLIRSGPELVGLKAGTEFEADWMRPYHMDDGLFVRLTDGDTSTCLILAAPKRATPFETTDRVTLVNALVPHLQLSLRTQHHVRELIDDHDDLAPAIDVLRHGIAILGANQLVVHLNSTAIRILGSNDGLRLRAGRVEALRAPVDAELRRSIDRAFTHDDLDLWGGSVCCPRPSGQRSFVIHVMPVHHHTDTSPQIRRAIVVIIDPELKAEQPASLLRRLYGLTAAEADIALHIARGADLKQIAEELSVSITTVRKHLQHLYDKTGTHRQAELVRLLLTLHP